MRGRVPLLRFFLVLLILLLPVRAIAQCALEPAGSVPFRASYLDVAVDGNDLWAATGYGVRLFDRSGSGALSHIAMLAVPGTTRVVVPANGVLYAGSGSSIHVIRRNGATLELAGSVETGATVNDILATPLSLYAATANGLQQYDLLDPKKPQRTSAVFLTTGANVTSLALSGSTLYAADGDSSIETFDITVATSPQRTGSIESLPRSTAVTATPSRLYVSDGMQTDVFLRSGSSVTNVARLPFGIASFALHATDIAFVAGNDRTVRAVDLSVAAAPVDLFTTELAPSGGTINRVGAIAESGGRLYVAGGDSGLLVFDVSAFNAPFPVRNYPAAASSSIVSTGGKLYAGRTAGGIGEYSIGSNGTLTAARQWDARVHIVHDGAGGLLLTSTGTTLTYWTLASLTPVLVSSAILRSPVRSAVVKGSTAYAVLDDRSLWSLDLSQEKPVPQQITLSGVRPSFIARSGTALAISDLRDDASTAIHYYTGTDFTSPQSRVIPGLATTGLALSNGRAAVFTYLGATIADFSGGTGGVVPQSTGGFARITFAGDTLVLAADRTVTTFDAASRTKLKQFTLPADVVAIDVGEDVMTGIAGLATSNGIASLSLTASSQLPSPIGSPAVNSYYRKIAAGATRLYLFDGRSTDIFSIVAGRPGWSGTVALPGTLDIAAAENALFTLGSNGTVTAFSRDGVLLRQSVLNEGADVQPLAIHAVRGVPWVSIAQGCLTGGCEKKTIVLDPATLVRTGSMSGAIVDVAAEGMRAFAVTDLPAEVRTIDTSEALHPVITASRTAEGTPAAVGHGANQVFVLADRLYAYSDTSLGKTGEFLQPVTAGEQHLAIEGSCGVIAGRGAAPQFFTVSSGSSGPSPLLAGNAKSAVFAGGRLYFLTDYSLEIWSPSPLAPPSRRHPAR